MCCGRRYTEGGKAARRKTALACVVYPISRSVIVLTALPPRRLRRATVARPRGRSLGWRRCPVKSEFRVAGQTVYDRRGPVRWIVSHLLHNRRYLIGASAGLVVQVGLHSAIPGLVGRA